VLSTSTTGAALQALAGLAIVVALIVATAIVLKRLQPGRFGGAQVLKPVSSLALGTRERVVVVEMGEQWLVLGVTAHTITALHTAPKGELPSISVRPLQASFADWLARAKETHAKA
jgi:flagellar protein FliO/FliZ